MARELTLPDIDLSVTTGEVELQLPPAVEGRFDLKTVVGDIDVDARFGLDVRRALTGATARGQHGAQGGDITVRVTTGTVTVQ